MAASTRPAVERRLFDSFLIVGLHTTSSSLSLSSSSSATSAAPTLSSSFSALAESPRGSKISSENGFDSLASTPSATVDVTSSVLYHYPTPGGGDVTAGSINPRSLCDFCFPDLGSFRSKKAGKKWKIKRETFSFVLTDTTGGKRWGYCHRRLSPVTSLPVCFCLLSFIPCFGFFSPLVQKLSCIEERIKGDLTKYEPLLEDIHSRPIPAPGHALIITLPSTLLAETVESGRERKKKDLFLPDDHVFDPEAEEWAFARPEDNDWMLDDINVLPLIRFLSPSNILAVFTSLLVERRVIFVADNLPTLSSCVQAATALLYPFSWQHIFIPVLPQSLLSFACAPMPYVIGVLRSSIAELKQMSDAMEEVVVVDVDNNKFYAPPELFDKRLLPSFLSDPLLHSLEIAAKEARQTLGPVNSYFHLRKKDKDERKQRKQQRIEEKLERDIRYDLGNAFIGFFIDLLGDYKGFIRPVCEGGMRDGNFDRTAFVEAQPEEMRPLLALIVHSQLFFMFIEDRKRKEVEEKRKSKEGKTYRDWKRKEMERERERPQRGRKTKTRNEIDVTARMQRKIGLQSRFSMCENGEISREDLAKRWKEIEKEERKLEKEKDKERKKGEQKKRHDEKGVGRGGEFGKEDIVLLLDRSLQKKISGEHEREIAVHADSTNLSADERAAIRGTAPNWASSSALPTTGKRVNPIMKVSLEKRSDSSRLRNSFTRSSKHDNGADIIDIASRSSSSIRTDDKKERKEKRKTQHKRNLSLQETTEETRRVRNMIDKEWKDEKDKARRIRIKEKKKGKDERKAVKKDKSLEKKKEKKLRKQKTAVLSASGDTGEDRDGLDNDFLLVTENFTRRRSQSDGAKEFNMEALEAKLAAIEKAAGQNSKPRFKKAPRKSIDPATIIYTGYLLKRDDAGKAKADLWERRYCVLSKRWLGLYAHQDDAEPVAWVKLKHIKQATFYHDVNSLLNRENGFALTLDSGAAIHIAAPSAEEGRAWYGAFQLVLISTKIA